jgi:hypothetical protein
VVQVIVALGEVEVTFDVLQAAVLGLGNLPLEVGQRDDGQAGRPPSAVIAALNRTWRRTAPDGGGAAEAGPRALVVPFAGPRICIAFSWRVVVETYRGPGSSLSHSGVMDHDRRSAWLRLHCRRPIPLPASSNSGTEASMGVETRLAAMTAVRIARDRRCVIGTRVVGER